MLQPGGERGALDVLHDHDQLVVDGQCGAQLGLIHIYSIGYMHEDPNYSRFFAFLNLFIF
ncbi:MAG: hypothetical protein LAO09_08645, partial [Acidobacteriia bacterium]|nr:hypothetical protein [Terriglobia bacterium]